MYLTPTPSFPLPCEHHHPRPTSGATDGHDQRLTSPPQPKELRNIKDFIKTSRRKDVDNLKFIDVKGKDGKSFIKFKLRTSKYLYTFRVPKEKAEKVKQSMPPSLKKIPLGKAAKKASA